MEYGRVTYFLLCTWAILERHKIMSPACKFIFRYVTCTAPIFFLPLSPLGRLVVFLCWFGSCLWLRGSPILILYNQTGLNSPILAAEKQTKANFDGNTNYDNAEDNSSGILATISFTPLSLSPSPHTSNLPYSFSPSHHDRFH